MQALVLYYIVLKLILMLLLFVKIQLKEGALSDDKLADDEENITDPKEKRSKHYSLLIQALKENDTSITKMNWSKRLVKGDLLINFRKVTMKTKMFKCQKTIIQMIKKVTRKSLTFFLVKILMMNICFRSSQQNVFYKMVTTF